MKLAIIGDTHFGVRSGDIQFLDFQIKWLSDALEKIHKVGIKRVVQAGDMFDNRKVLDVRVAQTFKDKILPLLDLYDMELIIVVGNHNIYYRDNNSVTNLFFFEDHPRVKIVKEYYELDDVLYLGWINKQNQETQMSAVAFSKAKYCVAHLELADFPMYKGLMATHGMDIAPFKKFERVYSGHYHTISGYNEDLETSLSNIVEEINRRGLRLPTVESST